MTAVLKLNPEEMTIKETTEETKSKNSRVEKVIREYYYKYKDKYFSEAAEDIGIWVKDYYAPDGCALADLSSWENEDEIEERALNIYMEELYNKDEELIDELINDDDFVKDEEDVLEVEEYLKRKSYKDLEKIFN
jgi:hypothetical protein